MKNHTSSGSRMPIKDFQLQLASDLIGDYCSLPQTRMQLIHCAHPSVKINLDSNPAKRKRGNCAHCRKTKHSRMNISWFCRECSVWFCHSGDPADCFFAVGHSLVTILDIKVSTQKYPSPMSVVCVCVWTQQHVNTTYILKITTSMCICVISMRRQSWMVQVLRFVCVHV